MGLLTTEPFRESCCDGGECGTEGKSALTCGCDPGESYMCNRHKREQIIADTRARIAEKASKPLAPTLTAAEVEEFFTEGVDAASTPYTYLRSEVPLDQQGIDIVYHPDTPVVRTFATGANRDVDDGKLDYEGFMSPAVIERFAEYMHKNRFLRDGTVRDSDNWQKGIPRDVYMKSAFRHFMDMWKGHRKGAVEEEALCALVFNVMGYLDTVLKEKATTV